MELSTFLPNLEGTKSEIIFRHERTVQIFSPVTSSVILKFLGVLVGQRAEIINAPKVVASGDGREITRTKSEGSIKIIFQVTTRDMDKFGYNV
jgi:B9 domain-containing protein 1